MRTSLLKLAAAQTWMIREDYLQIVLDVCARENEPVEAVAARLGRDLDNTRTVTMRDGVAIIPVNGVIARYANCFYDISGGTSTQILSTDFNEALANPAVRAILFEIDSPGGAAHGMDTLARMVYEARGKKPIRACIDGLGCSSAYYLAAACDQIIASPSSQVGCIGTLAVYRDYREMEKKQGILTREFVSSQSPRKLPDLDTEAGRAQVQATVDATAEVFVSDVARFRGVTREAVLKEFGEGGTFVGQEAVDAGLIDRLGTFEEVLAELASQGDRGSGAAYTAQLGDRSDGMPNEQGHETPGWVQSMLAWMRPGSNAAPVTTEQPAAAPASATPPAAAAGAATDTRAQELEQQLQQERRAHVQTRAEAFASEIISNRQALPAEREPIQAAFMQAALDDLASPLASGSRVGLVQAQYKSRPQHNLTDEVLPVDSTVLENRQTTPAAQKDEKPSAERVQSLLGKTSTGREVLAAKNGKGTN